jgi:hypothetical protein
MKLAEALILRADYQKRIEQLKARLLRNAKVQEGDRPAESPAELLVQLEQVTRDLQRLIQRINRTNATTDLTPGRTVADAIAQRDVLRIRHTVLRDLAQNATVTQDRYTKSEVKYKSTVNVSSIQKQADDLAKQHRELDAMIQAANWERELKE